MLLSKAAGRKECMCNGVHPLSLHVFANFGVILQWKFRLVRGIQATARRC